MNPQSSSNGRALYNNRYVGSNPIFAIQWTIESPVVKKFYKLI